MTSNIAGEAGLPGRAASTKTTGRPWRVGLATLLLLSCSPAALHAEASNAELAKEIAELKAQIREMRGAITANHVETRRAMEKVRAVAARTPAPYTLPPPGPAMPVGAVPAFVTADKQLVFGGITITPGGFLAAESVFRTKTTQSDINTGYGNIPFGNSANSHTNEYRVTGRQSRAALLAEGAITPNIFASGYMELDFLGAGTTSNATDTNSYAPRIRQLTAGLDLNDYGLHLLGGQMYSLTTLNSKGITPRNEVLPPVIDGQFIPGTIFARQAAVRITKDFDKRLWVAISAEEAQTTFSTAACTGAALTASGGTPVTTTVNGNTVNCGSTASGAGFSQYGQPYSYNHIPDIVGKVAYEAKLGDRDIHLEAEGLYRNFYDRVAYNVVPITRADQNTTGYGYGGGLVVPVIPRRLDFQGNVLAGRGIGRYGAGLLPDSTFGANGNIRPISEVIASAGLTLHATPALDIYAFAGIEKEGRAFSESGTSTLFGYGVPNVDNSGCGFEGGTCNAQTQALYQLTGGFWDKVYKGSFGEVRAGMQYSYTRREAYSTQAVPGAIFIQPKANENMIFTSLRYYPFQ